MFTRKWQIGADGNEKKSRDAISDWRKHSAGNDADFIVHARKSANGTYANAMLR